MIIIQKCVLLITFLFFVTLSSIFYYDSIERLKHRTNKLTDQKDRIVSNRDLINYFLISSSSNLYQPIEQFKSKLANFEESLVKNSLNSNYFDIEQNLISIKKNFNVVNFLMQNIQDARANIIGDSKLLISEMSIDSLITKFTDFIQQTAFRNHQNIQISINNNIKNSIQSDKEKLLKILINFSKIKLNQETNKLQLEFTEIKENNKLFLSIKISNAEQNKKNENYFPFYNLYLNEFSRNVYSSDQKSVIALENTELLLAFSNQLIMQLHGFLFIEPDNSFIIKIPILQQGLKHD